MGCWNGTCFLSNLSIMAGDRIKLQLLAPFMPSEDEVDLNKYTANDDPRGINGITYVSDVLTPIAPVISGEYNDYGSIKKVDSDASLTFLKAYVNELIRTKSIVSLMTVDSWISRNRDEKNPPKGMDATIPININDIDGFIDMVERGSILVKSQFGKWVRLRFVMMHEGIYQNALDSLENDDEWDSETMIENKQKIINFLKTGEVPKDSKDERLNLALKITETLKEFKHTPTESQKLSIKMVLNEILWEDFMYSENRIASTWFIKEYVNDPKNKKHAIGVVEAAYDYLKIKNYIERLRKPWALTGGNGSQHDNHDAVVSHSKMVAKFAMRHTKALEARYNS